MFAKVNIIILNWNGLNDTIECLESVKKIDYVNFEIIIVDNGSTDGSADTLKKLFPEITVIENKENLGYAEGNNVGIRYAITTGSEYIFLLNNDTVVDKQILNVFLEAARCYPRAGIFGAKIYYYSIPNKIWFAGGKWDKSKMNVDHLGFGMVDNGSSYNTIQEMDYITGCAIFFRKEVIEKIGLFDTRFYLVYEETDWCYRGKKAGFEILIIPKAKLWHKVSTSFGGNTSALYAYYFLRNRMLWAYKNLPLNQRLGIYCAVLKEFFPRTFFLNDMSWPRRFYYDILMYLNGERKNIKIKAKMLGVWDYFLGRFGRCPAEIEVLDRECK